MFESPNHVRERPFEVVIEGAPLGLAASSQAHPGVMRVLLVGTAAGVRELYGTLSAVDGAGYAVAGAVLLREPAGVDVPCAVLGGFEDLAALLGESKPLDVDRVLVCLPSALRGLTREVGATLDRLGVAWADLPPLSDQVMGRATRVRPAAELDLAALIDRKPRALDIDALTELISDRVVMITGAGGSIGSELARIVARFGPSKLVLLERSENALFEVHRQLRNAPGTPKLEAVMHDVTHRQRTADLLLKIKPDVVLHAAAHKHVPMMEDHPAEAVENNLFGTRSIADAADAAGVDRFVMISTDKAVNPSSVMGGTKRLAEMYIRDLNGRSATRFGMVRFGNVLGSACSVLPIWSDQLKTGGPITVTHDAMTRYFMTIPEAAGLVLEAACLAEDGEVFLLDMGQPVRVRDMAERFLRLQGLEPGRDVDIQITGPRPGEKLFEELAYDGEDMIETPHPAIRVWRTGRPDAQHMRRVVETFDRLRNGGEDASRGPWRNVKPEVVVAALRTLLPEMVLAAA
ncbi:MAG: SDR family NAD(P)-dependent oxidoreductase [Planctomycetota bacterium]